MTARETVTDITREIRKHAASSDRIAGEYRHISRDMDYPIDVRVRAESESKMETIRATRLRDWANRLNEAGTP